MRGAFGRVQRAEIGQLARRDQHAAGVHADVARQTLELLAQGEQFPHFIFILLALCEQRLHLARVGQRDGTPRLHRDEFGHLVAEVVAQVEHAPYVAHHRARGHGAECDNLRHTVLAVLAPHVVDDLVAPVLAEVDVEVRHRHALRIEEALEQQVVGNRVEVGDAERVGHQRARTGAAPGSDRHAVVPRPVDEVGDDEEVAREAHLDNGADLEVEPLLVARRRALARRLRGKQLRQAPRETLLGLLAQELVDGHARRRREGRQAAAAELNLEAAAPRDLERVLQRLRHVGEQLRHFRLRLEVLLRREQLWPALVAQHVALRDAHARLVRLEVVGREELHRMRGDGRQREPRGELERARDKRFALRQASALHLEVVAAREQRRPLARRALRRGRIARGQRLADVAGGGARKRDQPVGSQLAQPGAGEFGAPAALVLQPGARQQLAQREIPGAGSAQQQQPRGLVRFGLVVHPAVGADQRLDASGARRAVKLDHAEQIRAVSKRERRHAVLRRLVHRLLQPDDAIRDRVLAVQP